MERSQTDGLAFPLHSCVRNERAAEMRMETGAERDREGDRGEQRGRQKGGCVRV